MDQKVHGNIAGIRDTILEKLQTLYEERLQGDTFASGEMLSLMAECTEETGREVSVYLSRSGSVVDVSVGDSRKVDLPALRLVRNEDRLCGVRCIHTHPNGDGRLSEVDMGTLRSLRLDCMAAVGVKNGQAANLYAGYLGEETPDGTRQVLLYGPLRPDHLPQRPLMREILEADLRLYQQGFDTRAQRPERAILVGLEDNAPYDTLAELGQLAETAGAEVIAAVRQKKRSTGVDNATYIGSGKAQELALLASAKEADLFIFDDELSAVQLRNLEQILGRSVIDRTTLILDIFAARAQSREGSLQVELAQLRYRLPRLLGTGQELSRLGGGIGTRGPGEKKLEIDRRRIRRRIYELEQQLRETEQQRALRRVQRKKNSVPLVALVGYTNAGKSTLLNAVSGSSVLAEDKLFATLDPVVRKVTLPEGTQVLFSDTVGFINKLPHDLVQAFHSTLEEVREADLILHVVDGACPHRDAQMRVVEDVLASLGAADTPRINVYNKADVMEIPSPVWGSDTGIAISAREGDGLADLLRQVEQTLNSAQVRLELVIPYANYDVAALIRREGRILEESHEADGTHMVAMLDQQSLWRVKRQLGEEGGTEP